MTLNLKQFAAASKGFSLISNRKLLALYDAMAACRKLATDAGHGSGAKPRANSIHGREAAVAGATLDLLAGDSIAHTLLPAGVIASVMAAVNPAPAEMASYRAACQAASRAQPGAAAATVLFSGDGKQAHAPWIEALTFAAEHNLPFLFVQLHGGAAAADAVLDVPLTRKRYTLPIMNVDGNDVVAIYRVATEALNYARKGRGPTVIDCRLSIPADPLKNMQTYLIRKGLDPRAFATDTGTA